MEETKTSAEWQELCKVQIIDHDGWDRSSSEGFKYSWFEEQITKLEFEKRMCTSTCMYPQGWIEEGIWKNETD